MEFNDTLEQESFIHEKLLLLKEQKERMSADLAQEVAEQMKEISQFDLSMETINLYCSLFEGGQMGKSENREAGKILLEPLFEKSGFMKDRCVAAYIQSVRDDKNALSELGEILQGRSFAEKYLEYIAQLKEKSIFDIRKGYLEDEKMRFITTNIIDIDGTLDYGREPYKTKERKGSRHKFNEQIIDMVKEHPDDDFAICTRRIYEPYVRFEVCQQLIDNCLEILDDEPDNKGVAKFLGLLKQGKIKAYSKSDLINNEHVCLAGSVADDEMPEILSIQSLTDASVSVYRGMGAIDEALKPLWEAVPESRKITLQEFEDEKILPMRMKYLQNPDMKFITTELIDQSVLMRSRRELDFDVMELLLQKKEDWAIVYFTDDRISKRLDENSDNEVVQKFKKVLEEQGRIVDAEVVDMNDGVCLAKPFICSECLGGYVLNTLVDPLISIEYEPSPMDPRIKQAYEQIPVARKMTIKQYLDTQKQDVVSEIVPVVENAIERVERNKQKLHAKIARPDENIDSKEEKKNTTIKTVFNVKDMKEAKEGIIK